MSSWQQQLYLAWTDSVAISHTAAVGKPLLETESVGRIAAVAGVQCGLYVCLPTEDTRNCSAEPGTSKEEWGLQRGNFLNQLWEQTWAGELQPLCQKRKPSMLTCPELQRVWIHNPLKSIWVLADIKRSSAACLSPQPPKFFPMAIPALRWTYLELRQGAALLKSVPFFSCSRWDFKQSSYPVS